MCADTAPELNFQVDRVQAAKALARAGRVHIPDVLTDAAARRVHYALEQETPWGLVLNDGAKSLEFEKVSQEDYQSMAIAAWGRAHTAFQFFYHHYPLFQKGKVVPPADHYLARLAAFLNSQDFVAFIRDVTGLDSVVCISSAATLFKPLDYLTIHDDGRAPGKQVAFVLNLTPSWRPDWGGALQFFDRDDHIEEGFLPTFNALNLFRVPRRHSVSQVAAFGGSRYSVSGWFGYDTPS